MKRIKLFEAFNHANKIEEANIILLCWAIELFIKENELKVRIYKTGNIITFSLEKMRAGREADVYFKYYITPTGKATLFIDCPDILLDDRHYFSKKRIIKFSGQFAPTSPMFYKAAEKIIKKMYEDEKNKTI